MGRGGGGSSGGSSGGGSFHSSGSSSSGSFYHRSSSHRGGGSSSSHSSRGGYSSHSSRGGYSSHSSHGGYSSHSHYSGRRGVYMSPGLGSPYRGYTRSGGGVLTTIISVVVIFVTVVFIFSLINSSGGSGNISKSTVEREKIQPEARFNNDCIIDDVGWLSGSSVKKAMNKFYDETGVQPILVIRDNVNLSKHPRDSEVQDYMESVLADKGNDTSMVMLFCEWYDSVWDVYLYCGNRTGTVLDEEAQDIICDYVSYLYESDLDDDEFFSAIFTRSAERIMKVSPSFKKTILKLVLILAVITGVIVILILRWINKEKKIQKAEAEKRILDTPLDTLAWQQEADEQMRKRMEEGGQFGVFGSSPNDWKDN